MAKWKITVDADTADAVNAISKFIQKEKDLVQTSKQAGAELKNQARSTDQAAQSTQRVEKETGRVTRTIAGATKQLKSYIAGWVGLAAVRTAIQRHIQQLERIHQLSRQITGEAETTASRATQAAFQLFGATGDRDVNRAVQEANVLGQASGQGLDQSLELVRAGALAFGKGPGRQAATIAAAQTVTTLGLGGDSIAPFFEVLKQAGATTPDQIKGVAATIAAASATAESKSVGEFLKGVQGAGFVAQSEAGLSIEEIFEGFIRARAVTTAELAPTLQRTAFQAAQGARGGAPARAFLGEQAAARGLDFSQMSASQRNALFAALAQEAIAAGRKEQFAERFGGGEVLQALSVTGAVASRGAAALRTNLRETRADFQARVDRSITSIPALNQAIRTRAEVETFNEGRSIQRVARERSLLGISGAAFARESEARVGQILVSEETIRDTLELRAFAAVVQRAKQSADPRVQEFLAQTQIEDTLARSGVFVGSRVPALASPFGVPERILNELAVMIGNLNAIMGGIAAQGGPAQMNPNR